MTDWIEREIILLKAQVREGEISQARYWAEIASMRSDAKAEQDRADIIAAGRGHLIK